MIVEAMKTMNHVPSSADGVVKKIMVNDGSLSSLVKPYYFRIKMFKKY